MSDTLQTLAALVVKDEVSLGGLPASTQVLALAAAHATLPPGAVLNEREVNEALKAALAGPICWLATDHVELRRWLVDAGWMVRDGFGREYRALSHAALRADLQPLARALATIDLKSWVGAERERWRSERAARHKDWLARQGAGASSH
jgi:Uncharacterized protein conserved in bacteria (DUF2087)